MSDLRVRGATMHLLAAALVMALAIWLASGTLAPYGATLDRPVVSEPCHYLLNLNHPDFFGTYAFLDRQPAPRWQYSVVLRRILYPIAAYPLMKLFAAGGDDTRGFLVGGLITTILLHLVTLFVLFRFVGRRYGERASIAAVWLLATYPGITYWAGLPYSYAAIVPLSIFALIQLFRIDEADSQSQLLRESLLLGILFTGYDLLPFFGPAAVLLVLRRRSLRDSLLSGAVLLLPTGAVAAFFGLLPQLPLSNSNTAVYANLIRAWVRPSFAGWGSLLLALPQVAVSNFFYANFVVLPLAWLVALVFRRGARLERAELALLIAVAAVFLFNNAAPPYPGWQLRGVWIARLYQPVFCVFLFYLARWIANGGSLPRWFGVVVMSLNLSIALGPLFSNPLTFRLYARFYRHSSEEAMGRNLERFGRRPLGFCEPGHASDFPVEPSGDGVVKFPEYIFRPYDATRQRP